VLISERLSPLHINCPWRGMTSLRAANGPDEKFICKKIVCVRSDRVFRFVAGVLLLAGIAAAVVMSI
jgi:hypothetical protein